MIPYTPERTEAAFWNRVAKSDGCWEWTGALGGFKARYGVMGRNGRQCYAHRYSYELHQGPIPAGLLVCHKCDNPRCVRPDHLFLGTSKQNTQDAVSKGRMASGTKAGPFMRRTPPPTDYVVRSPYSVRFGALNNNTRLTEDQVIAIRRAAATNTVTYTALAKQYGVDRATIRSAVFRETWAWLPDPTD